jgi:hypothetical protein
MKNKLKILLVALLLFVFLAPGCQNSLRIKKILDSQYNYPPVQETKRPLILVHYMTGLYGKPFRNSWGYQWTANKCNPDNVNENGKSEIASHYYPLTGPYDESDPDILEYQILLMKISGIDGVVANWFGSSNYGDFTLLNENTLCIYEYCKRAGLHFMLNYEDRIFAMGIQFGIIQPDQAIPLAKKDIEYADKNWFKEKNYVKLNSKPVFTVFGPMYFKSGNQWKEILSGIQPPPLFFTCLPYSEIDGQYYWIPVGPEGFGTVSQDQLKQHMDFFHENAKKWEYVISGCTPGFHDYWKESGAQPQSFGFIDHDNGNVLRVSLQKALEANPDIIQIITWNDYIEGTMIEPTEKYGLLFLEIVQEMKRKYCKPDFSFTKQDLLLPYKIYKIRKQEQDNKQINGLLDEVFKLIIDNQIIKAKTLLENIKS